MAIIRKLVAQDDSQDNQWLKVDHNSRYIVNDTDEWQFLFGPNSSLSTGTQELIVAAQLDTTTLDKIRIVGYLYNQATGNTDSAATVSFSIYRVTDVTSPKWQDTFITTISGTLQPNNYFFADINISSLTGTVMDGDTTLMIEAVANRLGVTYRKRLYANHLGVYDSIIRLRQDVDFLFITKKDL